MGIAGFAVGLRHSIGRKKIMEQIRLDLKETLSAPWRGNVHPTPWRCGRRDPPSPHQRKRSSRSPGSPSHFAASEISRKTRKSAERRPSDIISLILAIPKTPFLLATTAIFPLPISESID